LLASDWPLSGSVEVTVLTSVVMSDQSR
jgi:hypothetical protein